jgi:hypothetical protein
LAITLTLGPLEDHPGVRIPFSLAALLALASSEEGTALVSRLKVLAITFFLPFSCPKVPTIGPYHKSVNVLGT